MVMPLPWRMGRSVSLMQSCPSVCSEVSRALIAAGIGHGDRVAIWAPNSIEWVLLALGLASSRGSDGATQYPHERQ